MQVFRTTNSFRMSFWIVPESCSGGTPCFPRDDEEREHGQHRPVHGHRHRNLIERDAVEQVRMS